MNFYNQQQKPEDIYGLGSFSEQDQSTDNQVYGPQHSWTDAGSQPYAQGQTTTSWETPAYALGQQNTQQGNQQQASPWGQTNAGGLESRLFTSNQEAQITSRKFY